MSGSHASPDMNDEDGQPGEGDTAETVRRRVGGAVPDVVEQSVGELRVGGLELGLRRRSACRSG